PGLRRGRSPGRRRPGSQRRGAVRPGPRARHPAPPPGPPPPGRHQRRRARHRRHRRRPRGGARRGPRRSGRPPAPPPPPRHAPPATAALATPVRVLGAADALRYGNALHAIGPEGGADAVLVLMTAQAATDATGVARAILGGTRDWAIPLAAAFAGGARVAPG